MNLYILKKGLGLPWWLSGKESTKRGCTFDLWVRKIPWSWKWQPPPVFLPRKSHGYRRLAGYSPWVRKESDMTEQLTLTQTHTHTCRHTQTQERPRVKKELPKDNGACQPLNSLMPIKKWGYLSLSIKTISALCITRFPILGFNQLWSKIFGKEIQEASKAKTWIFHAPASIYIAFIFHQVL